MDDLILTARLHVLRRNLSDVFKVVEEVESTRSEMRRIVDVWSRKTPPSMLLTRIQGEIGLLAQGLANDDYHQDKITQINKGIEELRELLTSEEIKTTVGALTKRSGDLLDEYLRSPMEDYLRESADRQLRAIDRLEADYQRGVKDPDPEKRAAAGAAAWAAYQKLLPSVQAVFEEYVDFLGGLAIRDAGYDHGICRLADELVREIPKVQAVSWNSLTVPARTEMLAATLARIIRLGFPEWSVWALPLAAYGLSLGLLEDVRQFREFVTEIGGDRDRRVAVLTADAFATYLLGPAYACALILLRLDVRTDAGPGAHLAELNQLRVKTVLSTLERLGQVSESDEYHRVGDQLGQAWTFALDQVSPSDEAGNDDGQAPTAGAASAEDERVEKIVEFATEWLGGRELGDDEWTRTRHWAEDLLAGKPLAADGRPAVNRFGQLLNAVWLARLANADPDGLETLAKRAGEYWEELERSADNEAARQSRTGTYRETAATRGSA